MKEVDGGVLMQGADFNGLETNFVSADNMDTLTEVVETLDSATNTPSGQTILVGGQEDNGGKPINVLTNTRELSTGENPQGTFTRYGESNNNAFVDTSEPKSAILSACRRMITSLLAGGRPITH